MKTTDLIRILLVCFIAGICLSCDKEDTEPLALEGMDTPTYSLYYGAKGGVTITGGDGKYSFICGSPLLKAEMTRNNYIEFEALGLGSATVTISDQSGQNYVLTVVMSFWVDKYVVTQLDAIVKGDRLTVGEQKELREKALATIPVKVGGGYKFLRSADNSPVSLSGIVYIYPEDFGTGVIEGTFLRTYIWDEHGNVKYLKYELQYKDNDRTFIYMPYTMPSTGPVINSVTQFAEDLKDQFIAEYPDVEQVYSSQVIKQVFDK